VTQARSSSRRDAGQVQFENRKFEVGSAAGGASSARRELGARWPLGGMWWISGIGEIDYDYGTNRTPSRAS
jgi:hypothetical protein